MVQQQKPAAKPPRSNSSLGRQLITLGTRLQQMPRSASVSSVLDRQSITFECTEFKNQKHSGRHPEKWTVRYFNIQSVGAPNGQHQAPALHSFTSNSLPSSVGVIYSPFGNLYQPRSLLCNAGIKAENMGRHMDTALISGNYHSIGKLQQHHRSNHNEATSGSVKILNCVASS